MRVRRMPVGRVLLAASVLLLVGLLITIALGGFRPAPAAGVRTLPVGTEIVLSRWQFVVQDAELVAEDTGSGPPTTSLRIRMSARWSGDESTTGPAPQLIGVVVAGGPAADPDPRSVEVNGRTGGFDPDVERALVLDYDWPKKTGADWDAPQPPLPFVPATVDVVLRDEFRRPTLLDPDSWQTTGPIGSVRVPVRDARR